MLNSICIKKSWNHRDYTGTFPHKNALQDSLRVWHHEEEPPEHFARRQIRLEFHKAGEKIFLSWRAHTRFTVHWDQAQRNSFTGAWTRPTYGSWRVVCGGYDQLRLTEGPGHWWQRPQGIRLGVRSLGGCHFGTKTWPQQPPGSKGGTSQANQPTE